ncbi:MAG: membrane protein insertase YidC, partial [Chitinophagaceae bacterium]
MNFDRNTVIGFVMLALLFFGYFYYNNKEQAAFKKNKAIQDSIANANKPKSDPLMQRADSLKVDSVAKFTSGGGFKSA